MDDNFDFSLISDFPGYDSCRDKTNLAPEWLVKNSKNMYKKRSGTIANRFGRKYTGPLDGRPYGVAANYDWYTSNGALLTVRTTADFILSVFYANQWIQLLTNLISTRAVFDKWFDGNQGQDALLMVNDSSGINYWSGGITKIVSGQSLAGGITAAVVDAPGTGYSQGDILQIVQGGVSNVGTVQVTSVSSGAITGISILWPGSGYTTQTGLSVVGGSGNSATISITAGTVYTITKDTSDGFPTWYSAGFVGIGGTITIGGVGGTSFTYRSNGPPSGIYANQISVTTDPSALVAGQIAFNPVTSVEDAVSGSTILPSSTPFTNDFIKVISNQVYIGCYKSRVIYVSSGVNYINDPGSNNMAYLFTFDPGILSANSTNNPLGSAYYVILDDNPTGISIKTGVPIVFGLNGGLNQFVITQLTIPQGGSFSSAFNLTNATGSGSGSGIQNSAIQVQNVSVIRSQLYSQSTPQTHEFIASNGNYIVWLGLDNQLHVYGATKDIFLSDIAPSLSQQLQDELRATNFTGGALAWIDEYIFISAPLSSTHYMFQQRQQVEESGAVKTEQIWNPPQITGISRFSNRNGVIYGHAVDQPMMYQLFDTNQWHDDGVDASNNLLALPYQCFLTMAYRQLEGKGKYIARSSSLRFDKIYWEGYMDPGTPLYGNIYYDYQGSTTLDPEAEGGVVGIYINGIRNQQEITNPLLNPTKLPAIFYSYKTAPSLGGDFLGDNPLGQGITPSANLQDYLPKFRTINKVQQIFCREYQIECYSYDLDARWEILALGTNANQAPTGEGELTR